MLVLIVLPAAFWIWIVAMARDMYGPMTGASAWMMTARWDLPHVLLLWAMWAAMMAAMMLPSAAPLLLVFSRRASRTSTAATTIYALAAGYLVVWTAFSLGATLLQRLLAVRLVISPMMETTTPIASAAILLVAGIYQWTPLKQACLRSCRSPMDFLMSRWRPGLAGAFRLGASHGVYCVGCCWALMLLLFVGGVMNLATIAALTVVVAIEKFVPFSAGSSRLLGVLLVIVAISLLLA